MFKLNPKGDEQKKKRPGGGGGGGGGGRVGGITMNDRAHRIVETNLQMDISLLFV